MMQWLNRFISWILFGCLAGGALTAWIAPKAIIWYFTPPVPTGLDCRAPISWSLQRFVLTLAIGALIGGAFGAALAIARGRRGNARKSSGPLPNAPTHLQEPRP
jgi:hypothetical protein